MSWGCVLLTTGRKPVDLDLALTSLLVQDVDTDIVVVGNGWVPEGLPEAVRGVHVEVDEGIPAGRNAGVPHVEGDLLFFLDDDASIVAPDTLRRLAAMFAAEPGLGAVQLRVDPRMPDGDRQPGGEPQRDWTPRLRVGDRTRPSDITVLWEGALAVRRSAFDHVGGWPAPFRFVHEGVDLGWRLMDAGYRLHYAGDLACLHPITTAPPHGYAYYYGARNRVWLARRHLPLVLAVPYVALFALRAAAANRHRRSRHGLWEAARGYRDGLRGSAGERRPLKLSTVWRMTRAGRPPIL